MDNVVSFLQYGVCPYYDEEDLCKKGVEKWWPQIQLLIFGGEAANYVCRGLNSECTGEKVWDCETCLADLKALAQFYQQEQVLKDHVEWLSGEAFCMGMDLDEESVVICQAIVADFIPQALLALFQDLENGPNEEGCNIIYDGICRNSKKYWFTR